MRASLPPNARARKADAAGVTGGGGAAGGQSDQRLSRIDAALAPPRAGFRLALRPDRAHFEAFQSLWTCYGEPELVALKKAVLPILLSGG
jgi:hypothetical protein